MSPEEFWRKVDKSGGPDACWPWTGALSNKGYGVVGVDYKSIPAHRLAYIYTYGEIAPGLIVRHRVCDNPRCCNFLHLLVGTYADNAADMVEKNRQSQGEKHSQAILPNRPRGSKHALSKLTEAKVTELRWLYRNTKITIKALAAQFGLSKGCVEKAIRGEGWSHVESVPAFKMGERQAKHPPERVEEIRRLRAEGMAVKAIAAHFGMSVFTINDIIYHRTHK